MGSDMKFFVDTADIDKIRDLAATGLVDGVTTNPSLVAAAGRPFDRALADICAAVPGRPVSAEVAAVDTDGMVAEGLRLAGLAPNIVVKVPLTWDGLKACRRLRAEGSTVNVTLCFSPAQALLAAKAGANFVSPFIGRLDDLGQDGMSLVSDIREIFDNYPQFHTQILVASVRGPRHVVEAARLGADIATLPPKVLRSLAAHLLTDKGLAAFLADWRATGQSIV